MDTSTPSLSPFLQRWRLWHERVLASRGLQRWWKELVVLTGLLVVLAAPWVLKPKESTAPGRYDRRLVILTPHNEKIRQAYALAFTRHWKEQTGEVLYVDWRVAGTAELALLLRSEYAAAFQQHWTRTMHLNWSHLVGLSFANSKVKPPAGVRDSELAVPELARKSFLNSNVGIGVDLFFGGGTFDFEQQAGAGILVATDPGGKFGVKGLAERRKEWFTEEVIPQKVSGEPFYDPELRWVGTCLSTLGICYNLDVLERLGIEQEPTQWADLGDPRLVGQVALSDPNKSGTVTKALEQIIQQQMQLAIEEMRAKPQEFQTDEEVTRMGIEIGWERGLQLIQRICANARYFTDAATKIPLEVAQGDAAAGMCIDFYGRSFEEQVRKADGRTRIRFVAPVGGTSIGVDPVGLLRGAPEPEVATAFMEFVLSQEGQKIWNYRVGAPGGPENAALRRLPVRRDYYEDAGHRAWMTDADARPFEEAKEFTYHPEWTASLFSVVRFLVKVMCIEVHDEQQRAWRMLDRTGFPPRAKAVFEDVKLVNYQAAQQLATELARKDKELEMKKAREIAAIFRNQYERAYELAKDGR